MCELVVLSVSWWFCVCVGGPVCELVVLCVSWWSCMVQYNTDSSIIVFVSIF